jgi:transcriptional regulator with XRE-family HTH domain
MEKKKPVSRIALFREQMGLTQIELAQLLDVTENTIANWEKGRSGLDWIVRVINLCKIFQCTPDQLIEYVPDTEPVEAKSKKRSLEELRRLINTHEPALTSDRRQTPNSWKMEVPE